MRKMLNKLAYSFPTALKSFVRNGFMNVSAIIILVSALVISGTFALVYFNIEHNLEGLDDFTEILVYAELDASDEELEEMRTKIESIDHVIDCTFISKEESLEKEREKYEENGALKLFERYDADGTNPLPDTYKVKFDDVKNFDAVRFNLSEVPHVLDITSHKTVADSVNQVKNIITIICAVLAGLLLVVTILIISNTIRLSFKSRVEEITIMRYIGATNRFIILPFIIEAAIVAVISSVAAYCIVYFSYDYLLGRVAEEYAMIRTYPASEIRVSLAVAFAALSLVLCIFSAVRSTRKATKA